MNQQRSHLPQKKKKKCGNESKLQDLNLNGAGTPSLSFSIISAIVEKASTPLIDTPVLAQVK